MKKFSIAIAAAAMVFTSVAAPAVALPMMPQTVAPAPLTATSPIPGVENVQYRQGNRRAYRQGYRQGNRQGYRQGARRGYWNQGGNHYYNGYRGYNYYRPGYRQYNGWYFPAGAFAAGAILGGVIGAAASQPSQSYSGNGHVQWCASQYRSYRASDNTFQPYNGPRQQCVSP
ncbi:BA14K-like protein [Ancylobacter aquaticus]|uniref:Lectin-like protein BA14k n=1 Tax=Ancylobacter aquaticus TaxID=100 RepID=A0A4R1I1F4_ANCAQ|nr:BA14K family protein [Ancylobacter aquaticus]TCK29017.1 BA14K-like protein [Ancylobacter aquaticus]